mgnify:CR=1 FL=1
MPVNVDPERILTGFSTLQGGMDFGTDASLIGLDQCAFASNLSFRGDLVKTRAPWISRPLNTAIRSRFQGALVYETLAQQGIVLAAGGHLYYITLNPNGAANVKDVTPILIIVVTATFTVPAPAATVMVSVSSETPFSIGQVLVIDSGTYTVTALFTNALLLTYVAGAANATVTTGAPILSGGNPVMQVLANPADALFVHLFQAEIYVVAFANQQKPVFFDGASARQAVVGEIPSSVLGGYAWGRIWFVLPDRRTFGAGDLVYGPSGTASVGGVDAILKVTENDFLNEGGFFAAPNNAGEITSFMALATIDTSLGIGPILFGTTNSVFSCNAPVDRTTWKNLTYPIQTISLLDYGPLSPRATVPVNNDMWFRSVDGVRSFLIARRDTTAPGNTPLSHEVSPILANDTPELLFYGSSALFNNRLLTTVSPNLTDGGITHDGLAVVNFDALSTMRGKQPPIWEGTQSGLKILQVLRGRINKVERCFAFVLNESADNLIELWEFLPEGTGFYDTYVSVSGINSTLVRTPIQSVLESRRYNYNQLVQLRMSKLYLDDIVDEITLVVKFRPDEYPGWTTWATIHLCASVSQCTISTPAPYTCVIWKPNARSYAARILLPEPSEACNTIMSMPLNRGYEFSFRFEGTGHYRLRKFKPHTRILPDAMTAQCPPSEATCIAVEDCGSAWFNYSIART